MSPASSDIRPRPLQPEFIPEPDVDPDDDVVEDATDRYHGADIPMTPDEEARLDRLCRTLCHNGLACRRPILLKRFIGSVNDVYMLEIDGHHFGVRMRVRESVFRYEPNIVKEAFVTWLLRRNSAELTDEVVGDYFRSMAEDECGGPLLHPLTGDILYFDWTREEIDFPFSVYRWLEGETLFSRSEPALWKRAGMTLAEIHQVRFQSFTDTILTLGSSVVDWVDRTRALFDRERFRAESHIEETHLSMIEHAVFSGEFTPVPTLVHNDFFGANIIITVDDQIKVIDWDNWTIDVPETDLIKMKYWTMLKEGKLCADNTLYSAFMEGYLALSDEPPHPDALRAVEALWLLKVFNFEKEREERGLPRPSYFPPSDYYRATLLELV